MERTTSVEEEFEDFDVHDDELEGEEEEKDDTNLFYPMSNNPKGLCLIFNNETFHGEQLPTRQGTNLDKDLLKRTFENLKFEVKIFQDATCTVMIQEMYEVARTDHSRYDCFVCCVLSHGVQSQVYGSDCQLVAISKLTDPVTALSCPTLCGKPKVFFIKACQGQRQQIGFGPAAESDAHPTTDNLIPNEADMLLSFSTTPGYESYREPDRGSYFVRKLCLYLKIYADTKSILEILTMVNHAVGKQHIVVNKCPVKQAPAPMFTLRKTLVFGGIQNLRNQEEATEDSPPARTSSSVQAVADGRQDGGHPGTNWKKTLKTLRHVAFSFRKHSVKNYRLKVRTSTNVGAGTDANVFVQLFGVNGDSGVLHLDHSQTYSDPFERGHMDEFYFRGIPNLGDVKRLIVWHDNTGSWAAWHLHSVEVIDDISHISYTFPCDQWLSKTDGDKKLQRDLVCRSKQLLGNQ